MPTILITSGKKISPRYLNFPGITVPLQTTQHVKMAKRFKNLAHFLSGAFDGPGAHLSRSLPMTRSNVACVGQRQVCVHPPFRRFFCSFFYSCGWRTHRPLARHLALYSRCRSLLSLLLWMFFSRAQVVAHYPSC